MKEELQDSKRLYDAQKKTNRMLEKILANKEIVIAELRGQVAGLTLQIQRMNFTEAEDVSMSLQKYNDILSSSAISELEQISTDNSFDRNFLKTLLPHIIPEVNDQKFTLKQLKRDHSSKLDVISKIFTSRIAFCTTKSEDLVERSNNKTVDRLVSKVLFEMGKIFASSNQLQVASETDVAAEEACFDQMIEVTESNE